MLLEPMSMAEEFCRCDFKLKILGYPERSKVVTRVLARGRQESERKRWDNENRDVSDVTMSQGMKEASRAWKRKGTDSFLDSPEGMQTTDTLI